MPFRDGTGPMGSGPIGRRGRLWGCPVSSTGETATQLDSGFGFGRRMSTAMGGGFGRGMGRGMDRGMGRGMGHGMARGRGMGFGMARGMYGAFPEADVNPRGYTASTEDDMLKDEIAFLEQRLESMKENLKSREGNSQTRTNKDTQENTQSEEKK